MKSFGRAFVNVALKQHKPSVTRLIFNRHTTTTFNSLFIRCQVSPFSTKKTVNVPEMGDSITEGTLIAWLKSKWLCMLKKC